MRWLVLLFAVSGCALSTGDEVPVRFFDVNVFEEDVQPVLAEHCGNPSCHGRPERALSIYSQRNWRADADRLYLMEPLTDAELDHNYTQTCVLAGDAATAGETLLLKKALADDTYHGGGAIFVSPADRDYRILSDWIERGWE